VSVQRIIGDPGFQRLKERLLTASGLAYYQDREEDIAERVRRRMAAREAGDFASYLKLLEDPSAGPREIEALIAELTIGETYFFRHREQFDALRDRVFPELLERHRLRRSLRVWSAGCATGAEPYSISILLRLEMADRTAGWDITILGTDINRDFLARAAEGRFDKRAFRQGTEGLAERCFRREGNVWLLRPEFGKGVSFRYHNLVSDPAPADAADTGGFDLVMCRNVLIYFDKESMSQVALKLHASLAERGWLVVGHAEPSAEVFRPFRVVTAEGMTLYRKEEGAAPDEAPQWQASPTPLHMVPAPPARFLPPLPPLAPPSPEPLAAPGPPPAGIALEEVRELADRGHWVDAASKCRELLGKDGLNPLAHFTLALILEHTGENREAERSYRAAIYLDRAFTVAHYHLGLLLHRRRADKEAVRSFQNVVELLARTPGDHPLEHADGITAAELRQLAELHLALLGDA
jgi:chemotaxis protein methyltransferase CheR